MIIEIDYILYKCHVYIVINLSKKNLILRHTDKNGIEFLG